MTDISMGRILNSILQSVKFVEDMVMLPHSQSDLGSTAHNKIQFPKISGSDPEN